MCSMASGEDTFEQKALKWSVRSNVLSSIKFRFALENRFITATYLDKGLINALLCYARAFYYRIRKSVLTLVRGLIHFETPHDDFLWKKSLKTSGLRGKQGSLGRHLGLCLKRAGHESTQDTRFVCFECGFRRTPITGYALDERRCFLFFWLPHPPLPSTNNGGCRRARWTSPAHCVMIIFWKGAKPP